MFVNKEMNYSRQRIERADGSYYNLITMKTKAAAEINFTKVENKNWEQKLFDTAQIRLLKALERGVKNPVVIVWAAYDHQRSAGEIFPKIMDQVEEDYLSLNALITEKLRALIKAKNYLIRDQKLKVKNTDCKSGQEAAKIIALLEKEKRIKIYQAEAELNDQEIYQALDYQRDLIAVGDIAFISDYSRQQNYPLAFNCSYFLLEEADWESKYSLLGDHYSLLINSGEIISPPLYNRSALLKDENKKWELKKVSLTDLKVKISSYNWDLADFKVNQEAEWSLYTRYFGVKENNEAPGLTPEVAAKLEITVINNLIVGVKAGGGSEIPQNGFIISVPKDQVKIDPAKDRKIEYQFKGGQKYLSGIQTGPLLVSDFEIKLKQNSLKEEEFFGSSSKEKRAQFKRVVPTDYADDIDQTRAARLAAGITAAGDFALLAVESVNTGMAAGDESSGATLLELAEWAQKKNFKYALNLDGGGSANIQYLYGSLFKTADRRGLPGVVYERMVPTVGFIKEN